MTTFDDRRDQFEKKFAHDEELRFKALARRNKLLGLWAAEKLGKTGGEAESYAKSIVLADFQEPRDRDVLHKVHGDLQAAGAAVSEQDVQRMMDELLDRAVEEVKAGR